MMRFLIVILVCLSMSACKTSSKKSSTINVCEDLTFDLTDGTINGVKPNMTAAEIKEWLPCYTKFVPNGSTSDCGGAILYSNYDFYFYTYVDNYIEVRAGFKGKVSDDLLHKSREAVRQILGTPMDNQYAKEDSSLDFFPREYGCLRVHYKDDKASVIAAHYLLEEEFDWCKE